MVRRKEKIGLIEYVEKRHPHHNCNLTTKDRDLEEHIMKVAGTKGIMMTEMLHQKILNEDEIVSKISSFMDKKETHKVLYKMRDAKIANYLEEHIRIPGKNNPWVQYSWYLTLDEAIFEIYKKEKSILGDIHSTIEYHEMNEFYTCPGKCVKVTFDKAYSMGFQCPACEKPMIHADNSKSIKMLKEAESVQKNRCNDIIKRCDICKARASAEMKPSK
ncbi:MAG: hypothetical protein PHH26_01750 [Candidatus Thermoplasmatota archaeon]|nr:hypothetical protein [Candidatus Thermoplasmatota archaeon]